MINAKTALALLLAAGATSAMAQYGATAPAQQTAKPAPAASAATTPAYQPKVSAGAAKEISALQAAVKAKEAAKIPELIAAANAKAKTKDDKYAIGYLQLNAAVDAKNFDEAQRGVDAMAASGAVPASQLSNLYTSLGVQFYNAKQYDKAAALYGKVLQSDPNNADVTVELARIKIAQGRHAEALASLNKAIAAKTASGARADETWYKVALSTAYNAKLPGVDDAGRAWLTAYPTKANWNEVLRVYLRSHNLSPADGVDVSRLMFATGAMQSENDYYRLATALLASFPGEAKAVLDQGISAGIVKKESDAIAPLYAAATTKSQGDRASLDGSAKAALAQPAASRVVRNADAYYGYGDYAKAAELYRAALGKTGADANLINLRLGMALARAGDKAGATAALNAVGGTQAGAAKLWLMYVNRAAA